MEKLKVSKYIAITDYINEYNRLIYSFITEKMLLINDEVYTKLKENNVDFGEQTVNKFIEAGILVDANLNELENIIRENKRVVTNRNVFSFTIFPSSNCQLGCHYCGQVHSPGKVDKNVYADILAHIEKGVAQPEKNHLSIGWFGGEPLLGMSVIEELSPDLRRIAERNGCSYSARITTNGLLFNRVYLGKLIEHDVRDITISLDGTAKSHDLRRPTKGDGPSFDTIMKNLADVLHYYDNEKEQIDIQLRINVDRYNQDDVFPLLDLLAERQFQNKIKRFDIAPIHAWGNDAHLRSNTIQEFADFKIDCYIKLMELGFMTNVPLPGRVKVICQAVTDDALYMQTDGYLYDCSELPLVPADAAAKKLGHIKAVDLLQVEDRNYSSWNDEILDGKFPCTDCRILPICGGGCPKSWKDGHIPCPDYKYNIEDMLALAYLSHSNSELFQNASV